MDALRSLRFLCRSLYDVIEIIFMRTKWHQEYTERGNMMKVICAKCLSRPFVHSLEHLFLAMVGEI